MLVMIRLIFDYFISFLLTFIFKYVTIKCMATKKHHDLQFHHPEHVLIVLAVFIGYMMGRSTPEPGVSGPLPTPSVEAPYGDQGTMCTTDALVCPDGTTVGRSGPNC